MSNIVRVTQHDGNQAIFDERDMVDALLGAFELINETNRFMQEAIDIIAKYSSEEAASIASRWKIVRDG